MRKTWFIVIFMGLLSGCQQTPVRVPSAPPEATLNPTDAPAPPITPGPEGGPTEKTTPSRAMAVWQEIGQTVRRRPILSAETGHGPLRILLVGGIHGSETEGRSGLEDLHALDEEGHATIRTIQDINPDGTALHRRTNARGVDLNRNWPAKNFIPGPSSGEAPLSEPEVRVLAEQLRAFKPDVIVVLHSTPKGPFVNFDGPSQKLAAAFVRGVDNSAWHVQRDMGYNTPGSLGSHWGVDRGLPIITVEFRRGQNEASAKADLERGLSAMIRACAPPRDEGSPVPSNKNESLKTVLKPG